MSRSTDSLGAVGCGTHVNESWHTYIHQSWVLAHIWLSHVTHTYESWHAYDWVMWHTHMSQSTDFGCGTHMNESWHTDISPFHQSCHTYECVMSQICMSHGTHMTASCHTYECAAALSLPGLLFFVYMSFFVGLCRYTYVLQCAVCCSVLQCIVACCSVLQCVAACCSVYVSGGPYSLCICPLLLVSTGVSLFHWSLLNRDLYSAKWILYAVKSALKIHPLTYLYFMSLY